MSYQVIARKYRPQTFDEVIGQRLVTQTLKNAIESERIAHAFLFSGVRGVGKTTTARILAKALNCHEGLSSAPCGKCPSCQEIAASNSTDVQEIDAASNTGVDSIRELRESVRYGTARDRFKIFIIDEVHMLSNAAFNALLKTLEEPPEHVKFIMATTEAHKIPVTITSRCQHFEFKPIQFAEILQRLKDVVKSEGIEISEYALRAIANEGQGSMRDAQSALDQILSYGGKEISDEDVKSLLGVVDEGLIAQVSEAVLSQDRRGLLEHMQALVEGGSDPQNFCRELVQHVRNLMVCRAAGWDERLLHLPDTQRQRVEEQAERFSGLDLIRFYDLLSKTQNELRWHSRPYIHLEIALMKLVELSRLPDIEEVIGQLRSGQTPPVSGGSSASAVQGGSKFPRGGPPPGGAAGASNQRRSSHPQAAKRPARRQKGRAQVLNQGMPDSDAPSSAPPEPSSSQVGGSARRARPAETGQSAAQGGQPPVEDGPAPPKAEEDGAVVGHLLEAVRHRKPDLAGMLPEADKIHYQEGVLTLYFSKNAAFKKRVLARKENLSVIKELCAKIAGSRPRVQMKEDVGSDDSSGAKKDPTQDPKVKAFLEAFPGKISIEKE
ncbi:MAG TPA: DNA polymerase III subunit gamma/tau [Acidobacteriota bacterium]|nr:DNA polymerase III subunit gamma/tau [Acidobacteriota bacterium]